MCYNMVENEKMKKEYPAKSYGYGIRHLLMLCTILCILTLFMGRSSLGVAVLAMTDVTRINDTNIEIYDWDKKTQGIILSSFFWGYMTMQIPAGLLARKYGAKPTMLAALLANAALCLILPTLARYGGWMSVCMCRMGMGLSQALLFPGSHTLFGRWLPPSERTAMTGLVYGGNSLGVIIAMPISGFLADTALGWKMIFYFTAAIMLVVALIWYWLAASSPAEHRLISYEEREYIESSLNTDSNSNVNVDRPTPWCSFFWTVPLWAIAVTHFGTMIGFTLFFIDLPTYLEKAMKISLKNSAILSALPYVGAWIGSMVSGIISEKLFNRGILSLVTLRKLFNSIANFGTAAGCIILAFLGPEQKVLAVVVVIITLTLMSCMNSGFVVNHLDLSPQFAGVLLSITNLLGSGACVITPVMTSFLLKNDPSNISHWRVVFLLAACIVTVTNILYIVFGSADRQPWDLQNSDDQKPANDELKPLKIENELPLTLKQ